MNSKEVSGVILPAKVAFDFNWESKALVTGSGSRAGLLRRAKRHDLGTSCKQVLTAISLSYVEEHLTTFTDSLLSLCAQLCCYSDTTPDPVVSVPIP